MRRWGKGGAWCNLTDEQYARLEQALSGKPAADTNATPGGSYRGSICYPHRMAKTASKTSKKSAPKDQAPPAPVVRVPIYSERVRRSGSDTEYEITYVSPDNSYVHIGIPRTNFEHRHVAVSGLIFLAESRTPPKPTKPTYNIEDIEERLVSVQHSSVEALSGEIAILKKYLRGKRVPKEVLEELDALCHDNEQRWQEAVSKIAKLLEP
jgi:hypothetical protein